MVGITFFMESLAKFPLFIIRCFQFIFKQYFEKLFWQDNLLYSIYWFHVQIISVKNYYIIWFENVIITRSVRTLKCKGLYSNTFIPLFYNTAGVEGTIHVYNVSPAGSYVLLKKTFFIFIFSLKRIDAVLMTYIIIY